MRALALVIACSGCVIAEPEGAPQFWPPTLGGTVEAVVAADLDATGSTDIVVVMSGTDAQAGLYEIDGGIDLGWGGAKIVRSFSRFVPMAIAAPVAAVVDDGPAPRVYVATGGTTLEVMQLSNTLEEIASARSTVPGGGLAWVRVIDFPGGIPHTTVSNGSAIEHFDPMLAEPRPIPGDGSLTWTNAQLATSYTEGDRQVVVVATADAIRRATIPTMPGATFAWEVVRRGRPWLGQMAHDFDGDRVEEIVGFDVQTREVCIVDPQTASEAIAPPCIELRDAPGAGDVTIFAGANLVGNAGLDIIVVQTDGMFTRYSVAEDVSYDATTDTIASAGPSSTLPTAGPPRGRTVIARPSPAMPMSVLTFGSDGSVLCALGPC